MTPGTPIPDWLHQRARLAPGRLALRCDGVDLTFSNLDGRVSAVARRLSDLGVAAGNRVAVVASSAIPFVELVHAIPRAGGVLVPINTRLTPEEAGRQIADTDPRLVIHDAAHESLCDVPPEIERLSFAQLQDLPLDASPPPPDPIDSATVHSIVFTSGASGRPKGVMLTFGNHQWSAFASDRKLGLHADDRWLACMPLCHVGGLAILLRSVVFGFPVVLHDGFDPDKVDRAIATDKVTTISLVPTMLHRLLGHHGDRPFPPSLRYLLVGGGPMPRLLLDECAVRGLPVAPTYGLTETATQVATLVPEEFTRGLGSTGKPLFGTEVRIAGAEAPGQAGEILVRGPTVTPGYFDRPQETRQALRDGWLRTGDIGYLDDEGWLCVLDRREDLVITGGENVSPTEVEEVLRRHSRVRDACVVGLSDPEWGQRVVAAVVPESGGDPSDDDLQRHCRDHLAGYKIPAAFRRVDLIPRTATGKPQRYGIRNGWPRGDS